MGFKSLIAFNFFSQVEERMRNRPKKRHYNECYNENYSELKILIDAQNKAKEYFPSVTLRPAEKSLALTLVGKKVFLRLKKHMMQVLKNIGCE